MKRFKLSSGRIYHGIFALLFTTISIINIAEDDYIWATILGLFAIYDIYKFIVDAKANIIEFKFGFEINKK